MDNDLVLRALKQVPEARLRLVEMAWDLAKEDGSVDNERASFLGLELEQAISQAQAYANATKAAVWALRELARS